MPSHEGCRLPPAAARNIGSSVGNRVFESPAIAQFWNPATDAGRATLDAMITLQAQIIAYIDDFKLLMIATLVVIPLLIVFKKAPGSSGEDHTLVVE